MLDLSAARNDLARTVDRLGALPLGWAGSTKANYHANLGDALSAVMVAAVSGRRLVRRGFASPSERMAAVGTIAHGFHLGTVHIWGSGMSGVKSPGRPDAGTYQAPADTWFHVHATRGPFTARLLSGQGIPVSGVYGDPVFLFPRFFRPVVEKRHELGVIYHISERKERHPDSPPLDHYARYRVGPADQGAVRILNTYCEPTLDGMRGRMVDILSCKRIVSTSLHGCIIAEAYGIPWLYFRTSGAGATRLDLVNDESIDLRYRDAFTAIGLPHMPAYGQPLANETDWGAVIAAVDRLWSPTAWRSDDLLESFPLPVDRRMVSGEVSDVFADPGFRERMSDFGEQQFASGAVGEGEQEPRHCAPPTPLAYEPDVPLLRGRPGVVPGSGPGGAPAPVAPVAVPPAVPEPAVAAPAVVAPAVATEGAPAPFAALCAKAGLVPLVWAARHGQRIAIADGLVPCIVSALAGLPVTRREAASRTVRLVSAGVAPETLDGGTVHLWGAGVADAPAAVAAEPAKRVAHAVRGPLSALLGKAAAAGDPRWLLPALHPRPAQRSCALGVVVGRERLLPDGKRPRPAEGQRFLTVPPAQRETMRLLADDAPATVAGLLAALDELLACSRIATTSWPVLAIAQAYGIPAIFLVEGFPGNPEIALAGDATLPAGLRDLYQAAGATHLRVARRDPARTLSWDRLAEQIDALPAVAVDGAALLRSAPYPLAPGATLARAVVRGW